MNIDIEEVKTRIKSLKNNCYVTKDEKYYQELYSFIEQQQARIEELELNHYIIPLCQCECHRDGSCGFYHCFSECCNNIEYKFINKDGSVDGSRYNAFVKLEPPEGQS